LVLDDPYDPLIADAVAEQPRDLGPLARTVRGIRRAWSELGEPEGDLVRRRVRIVARTPALRAAAWRNNAETERLIVDQAPPRRHRPVTAHAAAGAVLAAIMAALFEWARQDDMVLADAVAIALDTVDGDRERALSAGITIAASNARAGPLVAVDTHQTVPIGHLTYHVGAPADQRVDTELFGGRLVHVSQRHGADQDHPRCRGDRVGDELDREGDTERRERRSA
jgi:hypothetical protein